MEELLLKVAVYYTENCSDDTDGSLALIFCIRACVSFTFDIEQEVGMLNQTKPLLVVPGDSSNIPRYIRVIEVYRHYLKRLIYSRVQNGLNERKEKLVSILLNLCMSQYISVGQAASTDLLYILSEYPYLKPMVFDKLLNKNQVQKYCQDSFTDPKPGKLITLIL